MLSFVSVRRKAFLHDFFAGMSVWVSEAILLVLVLVPLRVAKSRTRTSRF